MGPFFTAGSIVYTHPLFYLLHQEEIFLITNRMPAKTAQNTQPKSKPQKQASNMLQVGYPAPKASVFTTLTKFTRYENSQDYAN